MSQASGVVFDLEGNKNRLTEIEKVLGKPESWDNPEELTPLLKEKSRLTGQVERFENLRKARQDVEDWLEMSREDQGQEVLTALAEQLDVLEKQLTEAEMALLLSGEEDGKSAILEIHPGAGGTEAQDWAEMLLRMYTRWGERHDFKVRLMDCLEGEGAGIKSAALLIEGPYAYGRLKGESGIHRLIRISPFDASGRRHTSFASVDVYPEVDEDIEIEIKDEDLRMETFRASGPGGQHVNKTSSAVRITHEPTGIVVQCQSDKSQHRNKDTALKILKSKLYELELGKIAEDKKDKYAQKDAIAWGSQIRTYTLQPYRLVKDHRTGTEIGNVEAVLDGDLDRFIRNYLLHSHAEITH